ncbi:hypothetical protein [Spirillospora sp. CA-128828]|uniref:hypothetical protein n=1 Tax=Spirillospora sp. CA-128828 TaxID=3240033 RepID=UPI003D93BD44
MTRSYQRVKELGFRMALSVGQHTNDRELSYYAVTPSGFEWEVGWNPLVIDETTWEPGTHRGISLWGHTPVGQTVIDKLTQFRQAATSLTRNEQTVPALSGKGIPDDRAQPVASSGVHEQWPALLSTRLLNGTKKFLQVSDSAALTHPPAAPGTGAFPQINPLEVGMTDPCAQRTCATTFCGPLTKNEVRS